MARISTKKNLVKDVNYLNKDFWIELCFIFFSCFNHFKCNSSFYSEEN